MRCFTTILVTIGLLLAAMQAPSAHFHQHESTQRHEGALFHAHFGHSKDSVPQHPVFRNLDPDDDAQSQHWFSAPAVDTFYVAIVMVATLMDPSPPVTHWRVASVRPNAHDPPQLSAIPARAPPSQL